MTKKGENLSKFPTSKPEDKGKWRSPWRSTLKPGFFWAKRASDLPYELVEIRYKPPTEILEVATMGWSMKETIESFVVFFPAKLYLPDDMLYKGIHE